MSVIDQAFIRAYQTPEPAAPAGPAAAAPAVTTGPPRPHFDTTSMPVTTRPPAQARPPARPTPPVAEATATTTDRPAASPPVAAPPRRPLSELVTPPPAIDAEFHPALEVDRFRYSSVVEQLAARRPLWRQPLAILNALVEDGRTVIGIAGGATGAGCTTVAACLARLAAGSGRKTALIDGDFVKAGLARELGLSVELGWEDVLAGRVPLAEATVQSLADGVTLLPLAAGGVPASEKLDGMHGSITAGVLRYHHDLVLVDLGSQTDAVQAAITRRVAGQCRLDGLLVVDDHRHLADQLDLPPELSAVMLGVIENIRST